MTEVANFLEFLSTQPGSLVSNLDTFITSLEKGQAGQTGIKAAEMFKKGNFAQELMLFLKEPGIYLDTTGNSPRAKLTAEVMRRPENIASLEKLSAVSQKIFAEEAKELKSEWLDPCLDLLSHDANIQQRGREKFAKAYHQKFEEASTIRLNIESLDETYKHLKNAVNNTSVSGHLVNKSSNSVKFLAQMISEDHDLINTFVKTLDRGAYDNLRYRVALHNSMAFDDVNINNLREYLLENTSEIINTLIDDSSGTNFDELRLTDKHMSLLRIVKDQAEQKIKASEENLVEDFGQVTKAITNLKIPFNKLDSSIKTESEGLGTLLLQRLIAKDDNGLDIFSHYRSYLPDSAVNFEDGTIQKFIQDQVQSETNTVLSQTLEHTKNNLNTLNTAMSRNLSNLDEAVIQSEVNSWSEIFIATDDLVVGFDAIAIESDNAKTFLHTRTAYSKNKNELIGKLNTLDSTGAISLSSKLHNLLDPLSNSWNSDTELLEIYYEVATQAKSNPENESYSELADLIKVRLEQKKQMQTSFLTMMNEEYQFQDKNGLANPFNRMVNLIEENIETLVSSYSSNRAALNLPETVDVIGFFTRAGQANLTALAKERQDNLTAIQTHLDKFDSDLTLVEDEQLRHQKIHDSKSKLIVDEYAKFSHIFKTMLVNPDDSIRNEFEQNLNNEIEAISQSRPVTFENGKVNSHGGAIRNEFSFSNMLVSVLQFLTVPFQDLLRGISENAG